MHEVSCMQGFALGFSVSCSLQVLIGGGQLEEDEIKNMVEGARKVMVSTEKK